MRTNEDHARQDKSAVRHGLSFRDIYLLAATADTEEHSANGAVQGLSGWIACYPKTRLAGTVFCGGVKAAGEVKGNKKLIEAYEMGKNI